MTGAVAYIVLLQAVFVRIIAPNYAYLGYGVTNPRPELVLAGSCLALLPAVLAPARLDRPSAFVGWMLYFIVHVPSSVVPFWTLAASERMLPYAALQALIFSAVLTLPALPSASIPALHLPRWLRVVGLTAVTAALAAIVVSAFGLRLPNFDLAEVYRVRAEYKTQAASVGRLAAYAVGWLGLVVVPLLVVLGLRGRSIVASAVAVAAQLYLFGLTGYKSLLFALPLAAGAWWLASRRRRWAPLLTWGVTAMVGGAAAWTQATGDLTAVSLLVRRLLVTPGLLTGAYIDYFSTRAPVAWSHSLLSGLVNYTLPEAYPRLISLLYLAGDQGSANVNFLADGYANLHIPGALLVGAILIGVLWLADGLARRLSPGVATAVLAVPCSALANSALNTSLMTHGILLALLLLAVLAPGADEDRP